MVIGRPFSRCSEPNTFSTVFIFTVFIFINRTLFGLLSHSYSRLCPPMPRCSPMPQRKSRGRSREKRRSHSFGSPTSPRNSPASTISVRFSFYPQPTSLLILEQQLLESSLCQLCVVRTCLPSTSHTSKRLAIGGMSFHTSSSREWLGNAIRAHCFSERSCGVSRAKSWPQGTGAPSNWVTCSFSSPTTLATRR